MESPDLRTNVPRAGQTWNDCTERVAAIYGPNAAGKTTLLEALHAVGQALRSPGMAIIHQPSRAHTSLDPSTRYEIGFVAQGTRYLYEIETAPWGTRHEALYSYPKGAKRLLFQRSQDQREGQLAFIKGSSLTGPTAEVKRITQSTALYLATAHRYGHKVLAPIAQALVAGTGMVHVSFRDRQDEALLRRVVLEMLAAPEAQVDLVKSLVQAADLGLDRIEIRQDEDLDSIRQRANQLIIELNDGREIMLKDLTGIQDAVVFIHHNESGEEFELPLKLQSSGTVTWLTTAWHALQALRNGSVLLVDELDASLHPDLVRYIVELFQNEHLNVLGAQLIFTTHDVSLLSNSPTRLLEPRNVWFVEKDANGDSEVYSMDQFDNRPGNNSERRYMAGKFGAVPEIDDALLLRYLVTHEGRALLPTANRTASIP